MTDENDEPILDDEELLNEADPDGNGDGDEDDAPEADADDEAQAPEEDAGDKDLPKGVLKRIGKLTARTKEAEAEAAALREKYGDGDPETFAQAAAVSGVVAELLTREQAEGLVKLHKAEDDVERLETLLDEAEESETGEVEVNGKTYTKAQIKAGLAPRRVELRRLERSFGTVEQDLQKRGKEIFKLGLAAEKAGFKPGMKVEKAPGDDAEPKKAKGKPKADGPASRAVRPAGKASGEFDPASVGDVDSLVAQLANRRNKK